MRRVFSLHRRVLDKTLELGDRILGSLRPSLCVSIESFEACEHPQICRYSVTEGSELLRSTEIGNAAQVCANR